MKPSDDDGWTAMMEVAARLDAEDRDTVSQQSSCSAFTIVETPQCPLPEDRGAKLLYPVGHTLSTLGSVPLYATTNAIFVTGSTSEEYAVYIGWPRREQR